MLSTAGRVIPELNAGMAVVSAWNPVSLLLRDFDGSVKQCNCLSLTYLFCGKDKSMRHNNPPTEEDPSLVD
ncbi:hypothetical protein CEXT_9851 [Caerostris extrusa]|uniref:Uncharacterized protein n=1 Tax=Caerostris extrusa TaxID=172846 RepID=A0AAV4VDQ7_CAEEX|nr:hypothetical protein CEXT_9851 [Caerostris extrusa]